MKVEFKTCTAESCKVTLIDLTKDYQPEENTNSNYGKFRYSDTISIDVLQLIADGITTDEDEIVGSPIFTEHNGEPKPIQIPIEFDGWFKIWHIILPNAQWVCNECNKHSSIMNLYEGMYFSDGKNIYKRINGINVKVPVAEILERNTRNTTISRCYQDYISICFLKKCYINLCQQIFNQKTFDKCSNKNNIDSNLVFRRGMVWMAINVIEYLVEYGQLAEASRLLNRLSSCNGLCDQSQIKPRKRGCGCK